MVINIWYPVIKDWTPRYNGNWDAANGQTLMCIGIFLDRRDIFDTACKQLTDGNTNGAIKNYFYESGQCQESGRDQQHVQMGLAFLCLCCRNCLESRYRLIWEHLTIASTKDLSIRPDTCPAKKFLMCSISLGLESRSMDLRSHPNNGRRSVQPGNGLTIIITTAKEWICHTLAR